MIFCIISVNLKMYISVHVHAVIFYFLVVLHLFVKVKALQGLYFIVYRIQQKINILCLQKDGSLPP